LPDESSRILVINPGSTSTKIGVYRRDGAELVRTIQHEDGELAQFRGHSALAQLDFRATLIRNALREAGSAGDCFAAVAGRGGLLPPMQCGTYLVDEAMIDALRLARRG
jgi:butyrate kinase